MKNVLSTARWFFFSIFFAIAPTLETPLDITDWLVLGPVPIGSRESGYDPLWMVGGEENIEPEEGDEVPSYFYPGGMARWTRVKAKEGEVKGKFEGVDLDAISQHWGWAGIISSTYAFGEIFLKEDMRALAVAEGISVFYHNGEPHIGDVYRHGYVRVPLLLRKGRNRFLLRIGRAYEDYQFVFRILPADAPAVILEKDAFFPSLYEGKHGNFPAALPVANTLPEWLNGASLSWGDDDLIRKASMTLPPLPPLGIVKFPITVQILRNPNSTKIQKRKATVPVQVEWKGEKYSAEVTIPVGSPREMRRETFVSRIDGSVGKYGILYPQPFDPTKSYALIFALHGAGVDEGLAGSYQPKDWAFVISPLNRRPFGFDWQDWGRLDALEVLDLSLQKYPIDANRVYLTGHSMGGQGTWHIGIHHADRFAAIAPSAGWMSFHYYIPLFLRKSHLFSPPALLHILEKAMREIQTPAFVQNLSNSAVFAIQGEKDESVPAVHPRSMVGMLRSLGIETYYAEFPNQGHWFDLPETPYVDCVDFPDLMSFFRMKVREPFPRKVLFATSNPSLNPRLYWVEIRGLEHLYEDGFVEAEILSNSRLKVQTNNIAEFSLHLGEFLPEGEGFILLDGKEFAMRIRPDAPVSFHWTRDGWQEGKRPIDGMTKTPEIYGPVKQAFYQPFVLIYGTRGSAQHTFHLLQRAVHFANTWWWRASGFTRIVADKEVTPEMREKYNLVLFGGPETNWLTAELMPHLPIRLQKRYVMVGEKIYPGNDFSLQIIYPNPQNPKKFVVIFGGQSEQASDLSAPDFGILFSGSGVPDFLLYQVEKVKQYGWAGVTAAGFFDSNWALNANLMYQK